MTRRKAAKFGTGSLFDGMKLATDMPVVIARRMAILAKGGAQAQTETVRMVGEKMLAAAEAQRLLLTGAGPGAVLRLYRRRVAANRRRLGK
jgi:hypothetical protein